ncbi:ribosomal-protein-serine acetyltransferase [Dehalogenimonas sp. WBC-2]|nr:ribosomal-protein-serine acetyltransferase [Dehalogenimonas sp. WBC-2]
MLNTARLRLKRLGLEDAQALFSYRSMPGVYRFQSWRPVDIRDAVVFINDVADIPDIPGTWYQLAIFLKKTQQLIGDIGVHFSASGEKREVELGCTLAPESQGFGYATEALTEVIAYLFTSLKKRSVRFSIDPRNIPSIKLALRLGLHQVEYLEKSVCIDGEWCDDVIYSIDAAEWSLCLTVDS